MSEFLYFTFFTYSQIYCVLKKFQKMLYEKIEICSFSDIYKLDLTKVSSSVIIKKEEKKMEELIFQTAPVSQMDDTTTKTIVSKVADLIGVPKKFFEDEYSPPQIEEYEKLDQIKTARIIRNLCMFRTLIESNYRSIKRKIRDEYRTVITIEETANIVKALSEDGIEIARNPNKRLQTFVVETNKEISNRINNCKSIFPDWIVWKYLRNIFIMPNGTIEQKVQKHINDYYYEYKSWYPYMVYINWPPEDSGNILYNDRKFLTCLYKWNNDQFTDISKVSKLDNTTKFNIDEFIEDSNKLDIIVDCENSDSYKLVVSKVISSAFVGLGIRSEKYYGKKIKRKSIGFVKKKAFAFAIASENIFNFSCFSCTKQTLITKFEMTK